MEKKILVAVDTSNHSAKAVRYAAEIYETLKDVKLTLLHVQPAISQYILDEVKKSPKANAELKKMMRKNNAAAQQLLDMLKQKMTRIGASGADIEITTRPRVLGVAKDILEYSVAGSFDAVILGRRGLSGIAEYFAGSVSANIVNNSDFMPIWLVDEKALSKNIMVAVDGSESSLKAVDHLAFIVGDNPDLKISFLHVTPRLTDVCPVDFGDSDTETLEEIIRQGDNECIDRFFSHALKKLKEAGIQESQIEVHSIEGIYRPGKAIIAAYRKGKFGALVIGRRGTGKKFFTGSVSRYLLDHFTDGALWVVP